MFCFLKKSMYDEIWDFIIIFSNLKEVLKTEKLLHCLNAVSYTYAILSLNSQAYLY